MFVAFPLALLLATISAPPSIQRCVDAQGAVSYQQLPCPPGQDVTTIPIRADEVRLAPAPPPFVPKPAEATAPPLRAVERPPPALAWRCTTADGTRFYRHDGCPAQVSVRQTYAWAGQTPVTLPVFVPVFAQEVPRKLACDAIYRPDARRRQGAEHDQRFSVYARATGRDPCR
jgi:hypothetical protein